MEVDAGMELDLAAIRDVIAAVFAEHEPLGLYVGGWEGSLSFSDDNDSCEFGGLGSLRATQPRVDAFARCIAAMRRTNPTMSLGELVPLPSLLALRGIQTIEDFERYASDLDLGEEALRRLTS